MEEIILTKPISFNLKSLQIIDFYANKKNISRAQAVRIMTDEFIDNHKLEELYKQENGIN